ncbi:MULTISPECIES: universal stress protein [unclassified Streptomyces]|uniref:universal stress protein n=1 Tax=unclassified Streptomyces TaxID=2593676 RepID=UPI00166154FA|nr:MULTISPECIES: universal stress protein [unclassified Streptomyces]MBD0709027.1 universal stress protein [Streptomyces sp. CBMA291]MBD0715401.1 universal stress protein [Streptomyces sp. CBMA370]
MNDTSTAPEQPVVVGVDGSQHSLRALEWALSTAEHLGSPLVVTHVRSGTALGPPDPVLNAVRIIVDERGHRVPVRYESPYGTVADALASQARGARLLVTGSRGHGGFATLLLGSTGRTLAASAPCPLVVVPHEARAAALEGGAGAGRVLLGLQTDETPDEVIAFAFEAAHHRGVPLRAMTAFRFPPQMGALLAAPSPALQVPPPLPPDEGSQELLREAEREQAGRLTPFAKRRPDVEVDPVVVPGHAAGRLVEGSREAGLVVVGRHRRHRLGSLLLGSVAHEVLREAHCPVAVVPAEPLD